MLRLFDFIDKRDGVVFKGNAAASFVAQRLSLPIRNLPVLSPAQIRPMATGRSSRAAFPLSDGPETPLPWSPLPCRRPGSPAGQPRAGPAQFQAAGATHDEITGNARGTDGLDQRHRIARSEVHGADHGIVTLKQFRKPCLIEDIALLPLRSAGWRSFQGCGRSPSLVPRSESSFRIRDPALPEAPMSAILAMAFSFIGIVVGLDNRPLGEVMVSQPRLQEVSRR